MDQKYNKYVNRNFEVYFNSLISLLTEQECHIESGLNTNWITINISEGKVQRQLPTWFVTFIKEMTKMKYRTYPSARGLENNSHNDK